MASHLRDDVIAWWLAHGPDHEHGGVLSCWDNRGEHLISDDKYTWSQGRWAWLTARLAMASRAGVLDLDPEPLVQTALATGRFVADHALLADGTTAYRTSRAGTPLETDGRLHASVYADLFAALGFAGLAQLEPSGGHAGVTWVHRGVALLGSAANRHRRADYLCEPYPVPDGRATFAMPMMLLVVAEQLVRAGAGDGARAIVLEALDQIDALHWTDRDAVELPRLDGAADDQSLLGRHRCPGHLLESLWFVVHAADLAEGHPCTDPQRWVELAVSACEAGWDDEHGGLYRYVDVEGGRPRGDSDHRGYAALVERTWHTKLWWPHAEAMYALSHIAQRTGDERVAAWRDRVTEYTLRTFPQGAGHEWIQNRRRDGSPLDEVVALPVKDPMHVARSLLLLVEGASSRSTTTTEGL